MKIKRIIIMSALAATALHASATDVYVYASGNFKPLASLENVRKIINGTTLTTIISTKGDTVKVENAAFDYLTAHPWLCQRPQFPQECMS